MMGMMMHDGYPMVSSTFTRLLWPCNNFPATGMGCWCDATSVASSAFHTYTKASSDAEATSLPSAENLGVQQFNDE